MPKIKDKAWKISRFLTTDVLHLEKKDLPRIQAFFIPILRIASLAVRRFIQDNCVLRASALTFYSLLSIVPVMALAFGIAKGFGLEQRLESQLYQRLAGQEEVLGKVITFSRNLLENTKGGVIAGIGVIVLFWSAIKLLGHIEKALNEIWKVPSRSFIRRFTDYLAVMILSPLLVIVSSSVTVYITTEVKAITAKLALLKVASPLIFLMLKLLPFGLIWLLFILIYVVMPNIQPHWRSSIIAGILAGTFFQLFQRIYISAQVLVAKYNAIYGSFAALPLFLVWLQLSWMIVIFGAQIAYAYQHAGHAAVVSEVDRASRRTRKVYGLMILKYIIGCFEKGTPAPSAGRIADAVRLPPELVRQLLGELKTSALVSEATGNPSEGATFQPARDIHSITVSSFLEAWDRSGPGPGPPSGDTGLKRIEAALESIAREIEQSPANRLVKDL